MKNQIILITGGSSGIGLEMAKQMVKLGNRVIICGRSEEKLESARKQELELAWLIFLYSFSKLLRNNAEK